MLAACSATSSTDSAAQLTDAISRQRAAVERCAAPAELSLCWDGSTPAPFDAAAPGRRRCPSPITIPAGELSMPAMAAIAAQAIAWGAKEEARRLARADWDIACRAAAGGEGT